MIQWAATICCWILLGLLFLAEYARWAVIAAGSFISLVAVLVIGGGIAGHVRRLRYARDTDQAVRLVSDLPGPDSPQASGVTGDSDTGVMNIDAEYRALLDKEAGRG